MTNLQAALGVGQIERMEQIVARKRAIAAAYNGCLKDVAGIQPPMEENWAKNVYWVYGLVLSGDDGPTASEVAGKLHDLGIETRPFFLGMHQQPVFNRMGLFRNSSFPVAERLARYGFYLPSGLTITDNQIEFVSQSLRSVFS